jgi:XRE family transcriptional regulator, regulator of sulfur utilization
LSLDQVAELTGVSKAMLGQIERGESNPTVTTLWKIATGLSLSFSTLLEEKTEKVKIVYPGQSHCISSDKGRYLVYPIFPYDSEKKMEIYTILLRPGAHQASPGHQYDIEEFITVSSGELELEIDGKNYTIPEGASISFVANLPHVYKNPSDKTVKLHLVIYYPSNYTR